MSDADKRIAIMNKAHEVLLKVVEILDKDLPNEMSIEENTNASCYIGLGIITANLMHCDTHKERAEMANILINHCIETVENSVNSLDAMMPERPSGLILPN